MVVPCPVAMGESRGLEREYAALEWLGKRGCYLPIV
jgi:hypothetical protein